MQNRRAMLFVDGENLVRRFESMVKSGAVPHKDVIHEKETYVWHPTITRYLKHHIIRVNYYTSLVGDDARILEVTERVASIGYNHDLMVSGDTEMYLCANIYKKETRSTKSHSVDINIAIDTMRHSMANDLDVVYLVSGDGDFLPLVSEVMRHGKRLVVFALSDGLSRRMKSASDQYIQMNRFLFSDWPGRER